MKKKILSLVLAFAMVVSLFPGMSMMASAESVIKSLEDCIRFSEQEPSKLIVAKPDGVFDSLYYKVIDADEIAGFNALISTDVQAYTWDGWSGPSGGEVFDLEDEAYGGTLNLVIATADGNDQITGIFAGTYTVSPAGNQPGDSTGTGTETVSALELTLNWANMTSIADSAEDEYQFSGNFVTADPAALDASSAMAMWAIYDPVNFPDEWMVVSEYERKGYGLAENSVIGLMFGALEADGYKLADEVALTFTNVPNDNLPTGGEIVFNDVQSAGDGKNGLMAAVKLGTKAEVDALLSDSEGGNTGGESVELETIDIDVDFASTFGVLIEGDAQTLPALITSGDNANIVTEWSTTGDETLTPNPTIKAKWQAMEIENDGSYEIVDTNDPEKAGAIKVTITGNFTLSDDFRFAFGDLEKVDGFSIGEAVGLNGESLCVLEDGSCVFYIGCGFDESGGEPGDAGALEIDAHIDWSRIPSLDISNLKNSEYDPDDYDDHYNEAVFVDGAGIYGGLENAYWAIKVTESNISNICAMVDMSEEALAEYQADYGYGEWFPVNRILMYAAESNEVFTLAATDILGISFYITAVDDSFPVNDDYTYAGTVNCNAQVAYTALDRDGDEFYYDYLQCFVVVGTAAEFAALKSGAETDVFDVYYDYNDYCGYAENGSYGAMPGIAEVGETVTIRTTPDEGYEVDTVTVRPYVEATDIESTETVVSPVGGKYTFVMPGYDVVVKVTFKEKTGGDTSDGMYNVTLNQDNLNLANGSAMVYLYDASGNQVDTLAVDEGYEGRGSKALIVVYRPDPSKITVKANGVEVEFDRSIAGVLLAYKEIVLTEDTVITVSEGGSTTPPVPPTPPVILPPVTPPSGGSNNPEDVTTGSNTETTVPTTETTAKPSISGAGSNPTATVTDKMGTTIVDQAKENNSDTVVIAPEFNGSDDSASVVIPTKTVNELGRETNADLVVETPVATVTFGNSDLTTLGRPGGDVVITTEKVPGGVALDVTVNGQTMPSIPGGVLVNIPEENLTPGTVAMIVHEDGTRELVRKSVADVPDQTMFVPLDGSATVIIVDNAQKFDDVKERNWFSDAVAFASGHELFQGITATEFGPNVSTTRGMLATVIYRMENEPNFTGNDIFGDMSGKYYEEAAAWAASKGIVNGYAPDEFGGDDAITREQLAAMLWRYVGTPMSYHSVSHFSDADAISSYAETAVAWANEMGIMNGRNGAVLDPKGEATRAEVAQMLMNFMALIAG